MSQRPPYRITIIGGGTAGWMAAAICARVCGAHCQISLVESDEIGTVGVGEATIPQLQLLHNVLGIDEDAFMRATQASFKLGIEFVGWGTANSRYIHAFGPIGQQVGLVPFHHYWLRAQAAGETHSLWDYSFNAATAYAGKMARGQAAMLHNVGGLGHAFHFDAGLYARFLRAYAEGRGVIRHEGRITHAERHGENGDVTAVRLASGAAIRGDLFLDCSGFAALLLGQTLAVPFDDWSRWLPCDRALAVPCASSATLTPFTRSTAHTAGWQWRIPLQHRTGNGHVYCSAVISDEAAAATLLSHLDGAALAEPRLIRFTTGRRRVAWAHNVVALGLAAGFLEPLESTSIHLVQAGVERLLKFLPNGPVQAADRDGFNAQTAFEWERVRDFIILHYHLNQREEPFWRQCASMAVPTALSEKLTLFRASGRITRFNEELFAEVGWLQVMVGQGLRPAIWHPLADAMGEAQLAQWLAQWRGRIADRVAAMPTHADFIAQHCRAG